MKCPDCKTEMLSIYGYSYCNPCATIFMGMSLNRDEKNSQIHLVYCPSCGTIKVNLEEK